MGIPIPGPPLRAQRKAPELRAYLVPFGGLLLRWGQSVPGFLLAQAALLPVPEPCLAGARAALARAGAVAPILVVLVLAAMEVHGPALHGVQVAASVPARPARAWRTRRA